MFKKGFTLLELLLVIAIISVLAGLIMFSLRPAESLQKASDIKNSANAKDVEKAIQLYAIDHGGVFPPVFTPLVTGVYDLCLPNNDGCSASSIDAKVLIDQGYLSEIPIVPGCQSVTSTCYKVNYNAEKLTVTIENGDLNPEPAFSGYDWTASATWVQPSTTYIEKNLSIAKKSNGKLILVNTVGGLIYEGEVSDVSTLLGSNNTSTSWQNTGIATTTLVGISVFRIDPGLFLTVHDRGLANSVPATIKIYKSPSGNGDDWQLYSTVTSYDYTSSIVMNEEAMTGNIKILSNGRWVLQSATFDYYALSQLRIRSRFAIYTSDDSGLNWTYRTLFSEGVASLSYGGDMSKNIIELDSGNLYVAVSNNSSLNLKIYKSTDFGDTWSNALTVNTLSNPPISPYEQWDDDGTLIENGFDGFYMVVGKYASLGTGYHVYEYTDPDNDINIVQKVKSFTRLNFPFSAHHSAINIDGYLVTTRSSYVTGVSEL